MAEQDAKRIIVKVAYNYFQEGLWDRALEEYKKLIDIDPLDFLAHNMMGEIYVRKGERSDALSEFLKAAQLLKATNNLDKAIQAYSNILKIEPANAEANDRINEIIRIRMAEVDELVKNGNISLAIDICDRLSFKLPEHPVLNAKLAELESFQQNGTTVSAANDPVPLETKAEKAERADALKKNEAVANLLGLAEYYEKKASWDEAVEAYITLLRLDPENEKGHEKLKQIYQRLTQKDKVEEVWARIATEKKAAMEQVKRLGKTAPKSEAESKAAKLLNMAIFPKKENKRPGMDLDKLRAQAEEQLRNAVEDRRAREKQKTSDSGSASETDESGIANERQIEVEREQNVQILLTQSQMYIQQNMLIEAMRLAQNILELDPQNKDVRNILKQIYDKKNL